MSIALPAVPMRILGLLVVMLLPVAVQAAVPNESAKPAYAAEQTILQAEQGVPAPGWLSPESGVNNFDRHFIVPLGNMPEQDVILQRGGNTWRLLRNGPLATLAGGKPAHVQIGQFDVFQRARARKKIEILKHEAEFAIADLGQFSGAPLGHLRTVKKIRPF